MIQLLEVCVVVLFVSVMLAQVLVPMLQGVPVFPILRSRKRRAAEEHLRDLNEEAIVQALEDEFTARRAALQRHREEQATEAEGEQKHGDEQAV